MNRVCLTSQEKEENYKLHSQSNISKPKLNITQLLMLFHFPYVIVDLILNILQDDVIVSHFKE